MDAGASGPELTAALDAVFAELYACYRAREFEATRRLWDPDEPQPVYLAEEIDDFRRGWAEIEAYWADTRAALPHLGVRHRDVRAHAIAPDLAIATCHMHWDAVIAGQERPLGGDVRVTATFRRRADGWKLIHYVEAPLAPTIYFRRLLERSVTPGFPPSRS
jgi:ketosteroid isomerase-like protein